MHGLIVTITTVIIARPHCSQKTP